MLTPKHRALFAAAYSAPLLRPADDHKEPPPEAGKDQQEPAPPAPDDASKPESAGGADPP